MKTRSLRAQAIHDLLAAHRELSTLEWLEFRSAMVSLALRMMCAGLFSLAGWVAVNAAAVMAFREQPLLALLGVAAVNLAGAALVVWRVSRLLNRPFFALTKRETARDIGALVAAVA